MHAESVTHGTYTFSPSARSMTVFVVTPFGTPPSASMWRTMPVPVATREVGAGSAAPARLEALPLPTTGAVRSRAFVRAGAMLRGSWKRSRYQRLYKRLYKRLHKRTRFSTNVCNKPSYQRLYMEHPLAQAAVAMPNGDTEISTMAEPVTLKRLVQGSRYEAQRYEASTCPL